MSKPFGLGQSPATSLGYPVKVCDLTPGAVIAYRDGADGRVIVKSVTPPDVNETLWTVSVAAPGGLGQGYRFSADATVRVLYNGADAVVAAAVAKHGCGAAAEAAVIACAFAAYGAGLTSQSREAAQARLDLGEAFVALNGAPLAFQGRLNPDGPPYPRPAPAPVPEAARDQVIGDPVAGVWFGKHGCGLTPDAAKAFRYTLAEARDALAASGDRDRFRIMLADAPNFAAGVQPDPAAAALVTEAAAIGEHIGGEDLDDWEREAADAMARRAEGNDGGLPWRVTRDDDGPREVLLGRFATEAEAAAFISASDPQAAHDGKFSLIGPADD